MLALALLTAIVYWIESSITSAQTRAEFHFAAQIVTGNWSAPPYSFAENLKKPMVDMPLRLSISISTAFVLNLLSLGLFAWLLKRVRDLQKATAMRLLDRDTGVDSSIKTSIFKLLSETGKFSDEELVKMDPLVDDAIKDGRAKWLEEELPGIVGQDNAAVLKTTFQNLRLNPR